MYSHLCGGLRPAECEELKVRTLHRAWHLRVYQVEVLRLVSRTRNNLYYAKPMPRFLCGKKDARHFL